MYIDNASLAVIIRIKHERAGPDITAVFNLEFVILKSDILKTGAVPYGIVLHSTCSHAITMSKDDVDFCQTQNRAVHNFHHDDNDHDDDEEEESAIILGFESGVDSSGLHSMELQQSPTHMGRCCCF
jgi:hypothetical protein